MARIEHSSLGIQVLGQVMGRSFEKFLGLSKVIPEFQGWVKGQKGHSVQNWKSPKVEGGAKKFTLEF